MCGIAGILSFGSEAVEPARLVRMTRSLVHRGPDGEGIEIFGPCGLGHRRLSIIDLSSAGHQPMSSADGKLWLVYNGEVYNYLELRRELEARGARFRSHTDSEVILEAYRAYGLEAFSRFNGMWALAIWDTEKKELVLSRDRFGVKPLYVHRDHRRLLFASETKALLAADPGLAELDRGAVASFLYLPVVGIGRETYFRGIERFEAATVEVIRLDRNSQTHRYWAFTPPKEPLDVSPAEAAGRVNELLTDAVRLRFRSDVPVGTCLSGGLDSSSIVALAGKRLGKAPESFSAIYREAGFEEESFIDVMVNDLHLKSNKVSPDASDLPEVMERTAYYMEEPTAGPGIYSQYHVMRIAAPKVKVLLDGQGGDEVFGGYFPYFTPYVEALLARARHLDVDAALELLGAGPAIKALTGSDPLRARLKQALKGPLESAKGAAIRFTRKRARGVPPLYALGRRIRRGVDRAASGQTLPPIRAAGLPHVSRVPPKLTPTGDPFTDTLWDQVIQSSIPALLHYEDRNSMAFSIEARVPFLDYRLVEYAFSLPMREKIRGSRTKVVLREAMKDVLPEAIRERRDKKGYPTPFVVWLKQAQHHEWALDLLTSQRVRERGLVNPAAARALWDQHLAGQADHSWRLWQLISLELFCRRFTDGLFEAEEKPLIRRSISEPVAPL